MSHTPDRDNPHDVPPAVALRHLNTGYWISQAVAVAAKLGIADFLHDRAQTCDELALAASAHPGALHRLLRALASLGVFAEDSHGRFALTPLGALLRSEMSGSWRAAAIMSGEEWAWRPWGDLLYSVKSGQPAFDQIFGMGFDDYLTQHGEAANIFHAFMNVATAEEAEAVASAYDFSSITTLVDVGGGHGALLAAILKANRHMHGVLFDAPHVVAEARSFLATQGVMARCELVGGDFFDAVPAGGDAYILKWVLVGWDDERAVKILANCRRALQRPQKLLIVERLIPPGNGPSFGKIADLNLLVLYGGRHRTEIEYSALFAQAGFEVTRVVPTPSPTEFSIIEGIPV